MKVKACCEMMRRLTNNPNVMVSEECIPPVFGFGVGMNMDYCPWCGAKIEEQPTYHYKVQVHDLFDIVLDEPYDVNDSEHDDIIIDQIIEQLNEGGAIYTLSTRKDRAEEDEDEDD